MHQFLASLPGTEVIDAMPEMTNQPGERADFLLSGRRVIAELKALTVDTSHKIDKEVDKHRERDEFPLMYGEVELQKLLAHLPDGRQIERKIYGATTRSVEDAVRKAEKQTTETKRAFKLTNSASLLVMVNDSVELLDPSVVSHKVVSLLRRERTGLSNADKLDYVWLLFETHVVGGRPGVKHYPSILIEGDRAREFPWLDQFAADLQAGWAAANETVLYDESSKALGEFSWKPASAMVQQDHGQLARHEVWRNVYRENPHLRRLSDQEVIAHGSELVRRLRPHFAKGAPQTHRAIIERLLKEFTCFLEEAKHRGLDLRTMSDR